LKEKVKELEEAAETTENETLETERDEAIRKKNETEQELLATTNRLKNKVQELANQEKALEKLKSEFSQKDATLNQTIKELRKELQEQQGITTTLSQEKFALDKKLNHKITELEKELAELKPKNE